VGWGEGGCWVDISIQPCSRTKNDYLAGCWIWARTAHVTT